MSSSVRLLMTLCALVLGLASGASRSRPDRPDERLGGRRSDSVLPGAAVTVTNTGTQATRTVTTDATALFMVTDLLAGRYDVTVTLEGFKTYVQQTTSRSRPTSASRCGRSRSKSASSPRPSRSTAEAARIQTLSGERSGLITQEQINDITLKGRDYMGMLRLMPGVVDTANREAPGWNNLGGLSINGGRNNTINLTYDGVTNLDTGSNTGPFLAPGLDSIAEIKVLTSNYQAEYGRSSGGTINVDHQERQPRVPRRRLLSRSATRTSTPTSGRTTSSAGRSRPTASTTAATTSAVRSSCPASSTAAATSCSSSGTRSSCRARTRATWSAGRCRRSWSGAATSRSRSTPTGS